MINTPESGFAEELVGKNTDQFARQPGLSKNGRGYLTARTGLANSFLGLGEDRLSPAHLLSRKQQWDLVAIKNEPAAEVSLFALCAWLHQPYVFAF